jgi:hypothetical protein
MESRGISCESRWSVKMHKMLLAIPWNGPSSFSKDQEEEAIVPSQWYPVWHPQEAILQCVWQVSLYLCSQKPWLEVHESAQQIMTLTCHYWQLCCTVVTQHTSYNLVTEKYRQGVQELREQKQTSIWVASSCSSSVSIFKNRTLSPYSTASCNNPQGPTVHELITWCISASSVFFTILKEIQQPGIPAVLPEQG